MFPYSKYRDIDPSKVQEKLIELLRDGRVSDEAYDFTFSCVSCNMCKGSCELGLNPYLGNVLARVALSKHAADLLPATGRIFLSFLVPQTLLDVQVKPSERVWLQEVPEYPTPADIVFFTGCRPLMTPSRILTSIDILKKMNIDFVALAGRYDNNFVALSDGGICCGEPHKYVGKLEESAKSAEHMLSELSRFKPEEVVFICEWCYRNFRDYFSKVQTLPFKTSHILEFLNRNLDKSKLKPVRKKVTVHDSCNIGRQVGDTESIRKILHSIPEVELVEMAHNKEEALCCGYKNFLHPEAGKMMTARILNEAKATKAEYLITFCTTCTCTFSSLEDKYPFKVIYPETLLAESMGLSLHEDKLKEYMSYKDLNRVLSIAQGCIRESGLNIEDPQTKTILSTYFGSREDTDS